MAIRAIIFDFDGIILETMDIKTNAFRELFKEYPEKLDGILMFHLDNGGMSRFDKFRHIYKNILHKELTEREFGRLCSSFNKIIFEEVLRASFVKDIKEFLQHYLHILPMFVVSATPQNELRQIVDAKGLEGYFKGVYGSPQTKPDLIGAILKGNSYKPEEALFIGDSRNDYMAASEKGVLFAFRLIDKKQEWLKTARIDFIFTVFKEIENYIEGRNKGQ